VDWRRTLSGHAFAVVSAAFSPDGSRIVTASEDQTARVWDAATGKEIAVLRSHEGEIFAAFSPDGSRIVTASRDNTARIWDSATTKEVAVLRGHDGAVNSAAFSPDGSHIVTASRDNTARIWDSATTKEIAVLRGHTAAFSPDGLRIVTASQDGTVRIGDAATGKEIAVVMLGAEATGARGLENLVDFSAFTPDGARIVTASPNGTDARIWDAATGKEIAVLRGPDEVFDRWRCTQNLATIPYTRRHQSRRIAHRHGIRQDCTPLGHYHRQGNRRPARPCRLGFHRLQPRRVAHRHDVMGIAVLRKGGEIHSVVMAWDKTARIWDAATAKENRGPARP
jgi:WD40 repeat protein